jgi:hypothetical protein
LIALAPSDVCYGINVTGGDYEFLTGFTVFDLFLA